jgi:hypothetical protein
MAEHSESEAERFERLLPKSKVLTLIILKGHLLVEEQIDAFLDALLEHPASFRKANPHLHLRICLLRALLPGGAKDQLLDAVELLNTLRNRMAHHLEPPMLRDHIERYLRALGMDAEEARTISSSPKLPASLRSSLAHSCAVVSSKCVGP